MATRLSVAVTLALMSISEGAVPSGPAGQPIDEQRSIEPMLTGSELTVAEAMGKADTVETGTFVEVLDRQPGALGVLRCTGRIEAGRVLKGARLSRDTIDFEVSAWRKEATPSARSKYIFFIKTVGVDRPTAIKITLPDERAHGAAVGPNDARIATTSPASEPVNPQATTLPTGQHED